jgi:hypothetical protein
MSALTVRLPDEKHERLKRLARERGTTVNGLIDEMATILLAAHDAEVRFRTVGECTGAAARPPDLRIARAHRDAVCSS